MSNIYKNTNISRSPTTAKEADSYEQQQPSLQFPSFFCKPSFGIKGDLFEDC